MGIMLQYKDHKRSQRVHTGEFPLIKYLVFQAFGPVWGVGGGGGVVTLVLHQVDLMIFLLQCSTISLIEKSKF